MKWLFFAYSLLHINKTCVLKPSVVPNRKWPPSFSFKRFLSSLAVSGKLRTATLACVKAAKLVFSSFLLRLETACILNFLPCQFSMKWGETKRWLLAESALTPYCCDKKAKQPAFICEALARRDIDLEHFAMLFYFSRNGLQSHFVVCWTVTHHLLVVNTIYLGLLWSVFLQHKE